MLGRPGPGSQSRRAAVTPGAVTRSPRGHHGDARVGGAGRASRPCPELSSAWSFIVYLCVISAHLSITDHRSSIDRSIDHLSSISLSNRVNFG